jgi:hypothetical protein
VSLKWTEPCPLTAPIRPLQLRADGGYQLRLGVLGVPLIMVPDIKQERKRHYDLSHGSAHHQGLPTSTLFRKSQSIGFLKPYFYSQVKIMNS